MNLFFKILLNLYFVFQCFTCVFSLFLLIFSIYFYCVLVILFLLVIQGEPLSLSNYMVLVEALIILLFFIVYIIAILLSAISTLKIIQHKPLTKLQKFSTVIFPIITVPLYLYLIFKFAI